MYIMFIHNSIQTGLVITNVNLYFYTSHKRNSPIVMIVVKNAESETVELKQFIWFVQFKQMETTAYKVSFD